MPVSLITGALGQIGSDLALALRERGSSEEVVGTDIYAFAPEDTQTRYTRLDVTEKPAIGQLLYEMKAEVVYHLASLLSARGEERPHLAWDVNMQGLKHVLDACAERKLKLFWPSSIAVFGPSTPRQETPQRTVLEPTTIYGVTKRAGELLCQYYHLQYSLDVRSVRFPGILSYTAPPGGGTTDYSVEMLRAAAAGLPYTCFLRPDTRLPMMYMPDAVHSILAIMEAASEGLTVRTSYNLAAFSFTPAELEAEIRRHYPSFTCAYAPDHRQRIADSWPESIDDSQAREDWGWKPQFTFEEMVADMLEQLSKRTESLA